MIDREERREMSRSQKILYSLPATVNELAALFDTDVRHINAQLYWLRVRGLIKRTAKRGLKQHSGTGRHPHLWERT